MNIVGDLAGKRLATAGNIKNKAEFDRRRRVYYIALAQSLNIEFPARTVRNIMIRESKLPVGKKLYIGDLLRSMARKKEIKPIQRKRTMPVIKKDILALKKTIECTAHLTPLCLGRFVSQGEEVCIRCKNTKTPKE